MHPPPALTLSLEKVIITLTLKQFTQVLNGRQRLNDLSSFHTLSWKEKYKQCHNLGWTQIHELEAVKESKQAKWEPGEAGMIRDASDQ